MKNAVIITLLISWSFVLFGLSSSAKAVQTDKRLDILFKHLLTTKDKYQAQTIEAAIWQIWIENSNEEIEITMLQGINAMHYGELETALVLFNKVVKLEPKFAEGWNKRATVYYLLGKFDNSIEDIAKTLLLEPRHFGALSGLGLVNRAIGRIDTAVIAFQKALEINPHLSGAKDALRLIKKIVKEQET